MPAAFVVPDQTLDGGLDEKPVELAVDRAEIFPAARVVLGEGRHVQDLRQVLELARGGELVELAGVGEDDDVGRVPGLDPGREDGVEVAGGLELDLDAGPVRESLVHRVEGVGLLAAPDADDGYLAAQLPGLGDGCAADEREDQKQCYEPFHKMPPRIMCY
jgi:hypothetical protein